jgi:hypothetical protein
MQWVEEVEGYFYQISSERSQAEMCIKLSAEEIGPVGGPYTVDQYGQKL